MVFGFNECIAIAGWTALIFMQWTQYSASSDRSWYTKRKTKSMPPDWVFPLAWTLLYSALVVMMFFFTQDTLADSWQIILGFTLFLIHIALNKEWSVYFWDRENPTAAFYILMFGMLPTSLVLYVPFIVDNQTTNYFIPVIMVTIYNAWLMYAAYLNYQWIDIDTKK